MPNADDRFLVSGFASPDTPAAAAQAALSPMIVGRLLRMGMRAPARPSDKLIDRLAAADAHDWLAQSLASDRIAGAASHSIASGGWSISDLDALKNRCKALTLSEADAAARLGALAGYYLAIAAAIVHHQRLISSQPKAELASLFADLGSAAPEPWATLLGKAAVALGAA